MPASRRLSMFRKTKMCRFHMVGPCAKGDACNFAHSQEELEPMPDLRRMCLTLIRTGTCDNSLCKFVHNKEELQSITATRAPPGAAHQTGLPGRQCSADGGLDAAAAAPTARAPCFDGSEPPASQAAASASFPQQPCGNWRRSVTEPLDCWTDAPELNDESLSRLTTPTTVCSGTDGRCFSRQSTLSSDVSHEPGVGPLVTRLLYKTKMCTFHLSGRCRKRSACRFAHSRKELHPVPNLYRTRLCSKLFSTGTCTDSECRFAHSEDQLRSLQLAETDQSALVPAEGVPALRYCSEPRMQPRCDRQPAEGPGALPWLDMLQVKNTFLNFKAPEPHPPRRPRSAPGALGTRQPPMARPTGCGIGSAPAAPGALGTRQPPTARPTGCGIDSAPAAPGSPRRSSPPPRARVNRAIV